MHHYRVDRLHSNAFEAWKRMGSPPQPTADQYAELERAGQLALLDSPGPVRAEGGKLTLRMTLPRQAVSLIRLDLNAPPRPILAEPGPSHGSVPGREPGGSPRAAASRTLGSSSRAAASRARRKSAGTAPVAADFPGPGGPQSGVGPGERQREVLELGVEDGDRLMGLGTEIGIWDVEGTLQGGEAYLIGGDADAGGVRRWPGAGPRGRGPSDPAASSLIVVASDPVRASIASPRCQSSVCRLGYRSRS